MPLDRLVNAHRLKDDDIHLGQKQVGEDDRVWWSVKNALACYFFAIALSHSRHIGREFSFSTPAEPVKGLFVSRRKIYFRMPVAPIAQETCNLFFVNNEILIV